MRLTLSKMPLAAHCLYWARPDVDAPKQPPGDASLKGTAFHLCANPGERQEYKESVLDAISPSDARDVEAWVASWKDHPLSKEAWKYERALAFHPVNETTRFLDTENRDYSGVEAHEIAGTPDIYRFDGQRVYVGDFKTGAQMNTAPAASNAQLAAYTLALCRYHGVDEATVFIVYLDDDVRVDSADLDAFDLIEIAASVRKHQAGAQQKPEPRPGMHCGTHWCPAVAVCPATTQALASLAPDAPITVNITTDEQAARSLERLKVIRGLCDAVELAVKEYADTHGGVALGAGKRWQGVTYNKERLTLDGQEGAEAVAAIEKAGAGTALRQSTSKAEILRTLGKEKGEALLSELRAIGAMRTHGETRYVAKAAKGH